MSVNKYYLAVITCLALIIIPASAISSNTSTSVITHLDNSGTTPFPLWAASALIGLGILIYTIRSRSSTPELEADAIVSGIGWIPLIYTALTSFSVDWIVSSVIQINETAYQAEIIEDHIIYHFDTIGFIYWFLFIVAIVNTIRIASLHKALRLQSDDATRSKSS
jgi:hypothetical protein